MYICILVFIDVCIIVTPKLKSKVFKEILISLLIKNKMLHAFSRYFRGLFFWWVGWRRLKLLACIRKIISCNDKALATNLSFSMNLLNFVFLWLQDFIIFFTLNSYADASAVSLNLQAKKILNAHFDKLPFHGLGKDYSSNWWKSLAYQLISHGT